MTDKELIYYLCLENYNFIIDKVDSAYPNDLYIDKQNSNVYIKYKEKAHFLRALGILKARNDENFKITEKSSFQKLGYLIDVARNAVPKLETLKKQALNLALLGFNQIYFYLEDLFEVPNEPYFGYLRGRYSKEEIKEFDLFCLDLGIELVPAIQTLAHLNGIFQWPKYNEINDINDIILVGSPRTYELIRNCFKSISESFTSKRIHIGMDEAHMVGKGKYLDKNNFKRPYDVIYEHLLKVKEISSEFGFKLEMWSDMFFRLSFDGAYYSDTKSINKAMINTIPKDIAQFYWDYTTTDEKTLSNMLENHKKISKDLYFAAGAWKWNGWNPSNKFSIENLKVQLPICKKYNVKSVLLTAWSDDGAEASTFSTLPTIIYFAQCAYNSDVNYSYLNTISNCLFGFDFEEFLDCDLTLVEKEEEILNHSYLNYSNLPKILLYNDPLSGVYDGVIKGRFSLKNLDLLDSNFDKYLSKESPFKLYFQILGNLVKMLKLKSKLGIDIREAYQNKDMNSLKVIANERIPSLLVLLDDFIEKFSLQWLSENKTNGFDVNLVRLGGLKERIIFIKDILNSFISGEISQIEELNDTLILMNDEEAFPFVLWTIYRKICSCNVR